MSARVEIDLNVRTRRGLTPAGLEDADGVLADGDSVDVFESEDGIEGVARVVGIDQRRRLVYLDVDWASLRDVATDPSIEDDQE